MTYVNEKDIQRFLQAQSKNMQGIQTSVRRALEKLEERPVKTEEPIKGVRIENVRCPTCQSKDVAAYPTTTELYCRVCERRWPAFEDVLGVKHDGGKPEFRLLPPRSVTAIVEVLTFGARKYAEDNWKYVPKAEERYTDALLRHVFAWMDGERNDRESGLHHLAHAGCCILFLLWFEMAPVEEGPGD